MRTNKSIIIPQCLALLVIIQLLRAIISSAVLSFTTAGKIEILVTAICVVAILIVSYLVGCKIADKRTYFLPHKRKIEVLAPALLVAGGIVWFTLGSALTVEQILFTVAFTTVIPLFEELIMHGLMWHKLHKYLHHKWIVWLVMIGLYAVWQIGYIDIVMDYINASLSLTDPVDIILILLGYSVVMGAITGGLRVVFHNCSILAVVHSALNLVILSIVF